MISLSKLYKAEIFKVNKNHLWYLITLLPMLICFLAAFNNPANIRLLTGQGLDPWLVLTKELVMFLSFVFPIMAIIYPFIIMNNEYVNNGFHILTQSPCKSVYILQAKMLVIWTLLAVSITMCLISVLLCGYFLAFFCEIPNFLQYSPLFLINYFVELLIIGCSLAALHIIINSTVRKFLLNTFPFLMLIIVCFFISKNPNMIYIPYSYSFKSMESSLFGFFIQDKIYLIVSILIASFAMAISGVVFNKFIKNA